MGEFLVKVGTFSREVREGSVKVWGRDDDRLKIVLSNQTDVDLKYINLSISYIREKQNKKPIAALGLSVVQQHTVIERNK